MAPTANRPAPSQPASRSKNACVPVVPVIPLPIAQKQQKARQLKQQKQDELDKENQAKEEKAREEKAKEEKVREIKEAKEAQEKEAKEAEAKAKEAKEAKEKAELDLKKRKENIPTPASRADTTPSDISSPPATTGSTHGTTTTLSPEAKSLQSPKFAAAAHTAPVVTSLPEPAARHTPAAGGDAFGVLPTHNLPAPLPAPLSAGFATNGSNAPGDFVFPVQPRSGSAARPRGPSGRHPGNTASHGFHQHQAHPSNNSITFGFQPSNNPSPAPVGHGPLPPPPGLMGGPPYVPFNAPTMANMGPGDWAGPPGVAPVGDVVNVNGFTPTTAGFNSSNAGSFRGSHSPDHVVDGVGYGLQHQNGPFSPAGPNGSIPPRNDSMPPLMSSHFFHPGFPGGGGGGPSERHGGPGGAPVRVVDFQLVQHLQQQVHHSFANPQTADTHVFIQVVNEASKAGRSSEQPKMFAGHRAILSQSYTMAEILRNDPGTMHPGPYNNHPVFSYHLKLDDPYVTSAAAMQALRSLYGLPIEGLSAADQPISVAMDKALASLAAGFLFMLESVKAAGAEQVARLMSWATVERVFAFCLNGASFPNLPDNPHPDPYEPPFVRGDFRYGNDNSPVVGRLLHAATDFVIRNFPHDMRLTLGGGAVDAALPRFSRFPVEIPHKASKASKAGAFGHIAAVQNGGFVDAAHARSNGSVSMPFRSSAGGSASPQLMFGDIAPRDEGKVNGAAATDSACAAALPQILVNLPFAHLKHILEHPALGMAAANGNNGNNGGLTHEYRRAVLGFAIAEREHRRHEALHSIRAGLVIDNAEQRDAVLSRVQSPTPPQHRDHPFAVDAWDVLGYKEYSYGDELKLGRVWAQTETVR